MPKRGENIYKRKDGRWEGRYRIGRDEKGRIKYRSMYGNTYKEVKERMKSGLQKADFQNGNYVSLNKMTIEEMLYAWLERNKSAWKDSTYAIYRGIVENQIASNIGTQRVSSFTEEKYHTFLESKRKSDEKLGKERLSESYIRQIHIVFNQAFKDFSKKSGGIQHGFAPLRIHTSKRNIDTPASSDIMEIQKYLTVHKTDNTCLGILLCHYMGLRIGELCALQWRDINFEEGTLHVTKTMQRIRDYTGEYSKTRIVISSPKSCSSNRIIPISDYLLKLLHSMKEKPEVYILSGGRREYTEPRTLQYRFARILKKIGISQFNFHMLRHIFASTCMMQGFDIKTVSELLGHSNIQTTLNLYVHSNISRKRELINQIQF